MSVLLTLTSQDCMQQQLLSNESRIWVSRATIISFFLDRWISSLNRLKICTQQPECKTNLLVRLNTKILAFDSKYRCIAEQFLMKDNHNVKHFLDGLIICEGRG